MYYCHDRANVTLYQHAGKVEGILAIIPRYMRHHGTLRLTGY